MKGQHAEGASIISLGAGCSAWNAHHEIKDGASRSYFITRWVGWRFGAILGKDLRKVCGTLAWLAKITCVCNAGCGSE